MNDQRSLHEQLKDLRQLANQAGLYDAADFLGRHIEATEQQLKQSAN